MSDSVSRVSLNGGRWSVKTGELETTWDGDVPHAAADQVALLHTQIERLRAELAAAREELVAYKAAVDYHIASQAARAAGGGEYGKNMV